ncbi:MAG TPA: acetyl-CoA carboxylase biotin carboxyl carrier protein subunit [Vicinamibacterales bacterium]|jgi:biotin carboxyl carrier protein|nr:acetyl-CoA carboxylase biotin carboxyl carrier protein subunit [Vicinamibacterales bacterium]
MAVVTRIGDGVFRADVDGRAEIVYIAGPPHDRWAFWNGHVYRLTAVQNGESAESGEKTRSASRRTGIRMDVTAPMPATIVAIKVREGDQVKNGDTLLVLEAMKMELPIKAPRDGRVRAIRCREGELVQGDAVLVEFE